MRVVFDSSAFQPNTFHKLKDSALLKRTRAGSVKAMYGPVFMEEVIRTYGMESKRQLLIDDWLPFIVSTTSRLIDLQEDIYHRELVQGRGRKTNIYMSRKDQNKVLSHINNAPQNGQWQLWEYTKSDREIAKKKKESTHNIVRSTRIRMNEWQKRPESKGKKPIPPSFSQFSNEELDHAGRAILPRLIRAKYPSAFTDVWAKSPNNYPYVTTFVSNALYLAYYAMTKQQEPLDPNAQADLDIMLNLLHGDVLVTEEKKFMKTAFNDIWKPRGKTLLTVDEFVNVIF